MIKRYATKTNQNGWQHQLEIDVDNQTFRRGIFLFTSADMLMPKKHIDEMIQFLVSVGYAEVDNCDKEENYAEN